MKDSRGTPDRFAEELYWYFSEFENLTVDEVKKVCCKTLDVLMQEGDTTQRAYYGETKKCIKERGLR